MAMEKYMKCDRIRLLSTGALTACVILSVTQTSAGDWRLDLENAFGDQRAAQVYVSERDGKIVDAFAVAQR